MPFNKIKYNDVGLYSITGLIFILSYEKDHHENIHLPISLTEQGVPYCTEVECLQLMNSEVCDPIQH